ncbi:hypothetical protein LPJ53_001571 [Coemansia erecta]|uniref:Uncharacterized protein n=1 Tax=Coemansia erecta TaxID=147472 RepID=A0A9W7XZQ7_9FUNG|nr:hypothetical protein LPJ53_001571 [Coemansia erecta]
MSIQLTTELLHTFVQNARRRAEQTLSTQQTLAASVFGTTAHFHLVPGQVSHPLRRILGLTTEFILVSAPTPSADLHLRRVHSLACGAPPLATWRGLAAGSDEKIADMAVAYAYAWDIQRLAPLERDQARGLAAQYAQILPALEATGGAGVLPMVVFTREYGADAAAERPPFYLVVFAPDTSDAFANVVAVRCSDRRHRQDAPVALDAGGEEAGRVAHWAEYDVLGSPVQDGAAGEADAALLALVKNGDDDDDDDDDSASVLSAALAPSTSYAVLHGVWEAEARSTASAPLPLPLPLPPRPPASTQWVLELLSTPVARDAEAGASLRRLHLELRRLETWCAAWAAGTEWAGGPVGSHEWQAGGRGSGQAGGSQGDTETIDEAGDALERHRVRLGRRIDDFIDRAAAGCAPPEDDADADAGEDSSKDDLEEDGGGAPGQQQQRQRRALDFVEQLWRLAQHAHDSADLCEMLAAVGEALDTRGLQPAVHSDNAAPLAQLLRATLADDPAARRRLDAQLDRWIDGQQPLDAFVHAGAAKLAGDLRRRLVRGHLATPRQVDVFLAGWPAAAAADAPVELPGTVDRLRCLLRVLEAHALAVRAAPGLPRALAAQVAGAVLDHFASRPAHHDDLRVCLWLPVYSLDAQDFAASVVDAFDPARYAAGAGRALVLLTTAPATVDGRFAADDDDADGADGADDVYAVFEAR